MACSVQSYYDITGSGGDVYLVKKLAYFEEYLKWAGTEYIYVQAGYLADQPRATQIIEDMIAEGTLRDLTFEWGNMLAKVDLDHPFKEPDERLVQLFRDNYSMEKNGKDHVIFMGLLLALAVWVNHGIQIKGLYMDDLYFWSCYGEQSFFEYVFPMGSTRFRFLYYLAAWLEMAVVRNHVALFVPINILLNAALSWYLYSIAVDNVKIFIHMKVNGLTKRKSHTCNKDHKGKKKRGTSQKEAVPEREI